ncbi:hypothetical protein V7S43_014136 [Phytophthora oleae]|uniref:B box-type domain-containing protein n=1 Tax=Phytophthora oleae TaxID=2107226 RepID=A0ABD3F1P7_9STRA
MRGASKDSGVVLDVICRSLRSNQFWAPSKALSKCLSVSFQRFLIVPTPKDDVSNLIWTSVLVLVYCATHLVDYHESWYEVADTCTAWLRLQQQFVDQRQDLIRSACLLLKAGDSDQLLSTLFTLETEALDSAVAEEDATLLREGWQRCYLNEPPYTAYYFNAEAAEMERELQEKKEKRQALLAKVLPLRLRINRDVKPPVEAQKCSQCIKQPATVLCLKCSTKYLCDECCDAVHCDRIKRGHLTDGLRFLECLGRAGFPNIVARPRTPFMIYQDEQKKLVKEQQASIESNKLVIQNYSVHNVDRISVSFFITEYCMVVMLFRGLMSITHNIAMTVSLCAAVMGKPR